MKILLVSTQLALPSTWLNTARPPGLCSGIVSHYFTLRATDERLVDVLSECGSVKSGNRHRYQEEGGER